MVTINRKKILIISGIYTIIIFALGIFLGINMNQLREDDVFSSIRQSELNTESYLVEQAYLNSFGGDACNALSKRTTDLKFITTKIGQQLNKYSEKSLFLNSDLDYLKRKYFISEIKFLTLINDLNINCNTNYVPLLFFYTKDNIESTRQGYIITDLSEEYEDNLIILSFDKDYEDEPLVEVLKAQYGINKDSTIILGDDLIIDEFISKEDLKKEIDNF